MHIIFLGNTCNNAYNIVKAIFAAGHTCELYYDPSYHPQTFPETEYPKILDNWPDWIHKITPQDKTFSTYEGPSEKFLKKLSHADIIHCEGEYLLWAQKSNKPYFWYPFGQDSDYYLKWSFWLENLNIYIATNNLKFMYAAHNAMGINFGQELNTRSFFKNFLKKYYSKHIASLFFPINEQKFSQKKNISINNLLKQKGVNRKISGLVIFNPTRIMFTKHADYDYGSDLLLQALAELKKDNIDFSFIMCERDFIDEKIFFDMAKELNVYDNIIRVSFIPRHELPLWYSAVDIVTNEFRHGSLGSVSLEAMSCGTPLLTCLYKPEDPLEIDDPFTCPPPIYESVPLSAAVSALKEAALYPEKAKARGEASRKWILENVTPSVVGPKFIAAYEESIKQFNKELEPLRFDPMPQDKYSAFIEYELQNDSSDIMRIGLKLDDYPTDPHLLGLLAKTLHNTNQVMIATSLCHELKNMNIEWDKTLYTPSLLNKYKYYLVVSKRKISFILHTNSTLKKIYPTIKKIYDFLKNRINTK